VPYGSSVLLAGVVSWGKDCADIAPSMFARVSSFASWIDSIVGNIDHTLPPTVGFNAPHDGDSFAFGETISIVANASAGDSSSYITQVDIYINDQLKAQRYSAPYDYQWQSATVGQHQIRLVAKDNKNGTASSQININVTDNSSNTAPTVSIVTPNNNQSYDLGATIALAANAFDSDGEVTKVAFYQGSQLLFEDTQTPYGYNWQGAAVGNYQLTAVATDDDASFTTSAVVNITVKQVGGGCNSVAAWSASQVYPRAGDRVSYEGQEYENKWWTQGEVPTESGQWGVWKLIGPCS
jgi:chitinase